MNVILTEDVVGLGDIGETVKVRPGYARNFLVPRGLAIESGAADARQLAHHMMQIDAKKRKMKRSCESVAQQIRELSMNFTVRVASGGRVFGSITQRDIAEKLVQGGLDIDRKRVLLHEPLKKVGTHFVRVKLHPEVEALLKVVVGSSEASASEELTETNEARSAVETATEAQTAE